MNELPTNALQFGYMLARHGVIEHAALDDPEEYDDFKTLDAVYAAYEELKTGERP